MEEERKEEAVEETEETPAEEPKEEETPVPVTEPILSKRDARRQKRLAKLRNRLFERDDIMYRGPLSYRYLRIFAWVALIIAQVVVLNRLNVRLGGPTFLKTGWENTLNVIGGLSTPLFIIASFSLVFNTRKTYRSTILTYLVGYLLIGFGIFFIFRHYIVGIAKHFKVEDVMRILMSIFAGRKAQVNVFADLLALGLFNFFINYTPSKVFTGKKLIIFRLGAIIPIVFVFAAYTLRVLTVMGTLVLPFEVFPFLTTKSPIVHAIFILITLWIKNRERLFLRFGATRKQYRAFLSTNRNSLSFSITLSLFFLLFAIVDFITLIIVAVAVGVNHADPAYGGEFAANIGLGQAGALLLAIPFVMLFCYTRTHKNSMPDILIPIVGIVAFVLVYLEGAYQFVIQAIPAPSS